MNKLILSLLAVSFVFVAGCQKPNEDAAKAADAATKLAANKAAATKLFTSAWNNGDFAILDEMIPMTALDHSTIPGKSPEKGPASFKSIIGMFRAAIPDIKLTIDDELAEGDKVAHRWTLSGTHSGTPLFGVPAKGEKLTFSGTTIVRLENGKVAERWSNVDEMALARQLGLVPPPPGPPQK
jgi:predicted ester cyclase